MPHECTRKHTDTQANQLGEEVDVSVQCFLQCDLSWFHSLERQALIGLLSSGKEPKSELAPVVGAAQNKQAGFQPHTRPFQL